MPLVRRALDRAGASAAERAEPPTLTAIQDAVCEAEGLTLDELLSPRRSTRIARARQLAMYLARELTPLSLTEIARGFNRDHTTVLHAIRTVSARLEPGSETAETIHRIRATLGREHSARNLKPTDIASSPQAGKE